MRLLRYTYPASRPLTPFLGAFPRSPFSGLENEIDRLFATAVALPAAAFPVDLYEDAETISVRAELPAVSRDAIQVEMADGQLTIAATRQSASAETEERETLRRTLPIPAEVQVDRVNARYEDGILTVTLPKREEVKPKKIAVSVQ